MTKSLYICYFGLREPLVQTQVIPYLKEIIKDGVEISLLTFEPEFKKSWTSSQIEDERKKLAEQRITWHVLPYHKRPSVPATFYDVLNGTRLVTKLLARENYDILHARVHLPALMASIARKFSRRKPKILFDIRGFFPEEYTDAGVWPEGGWLYRTAKRVERWLLKEADAFVVLTEIAREILFAEASTSPSADAAATTPNQGGDFGPTDKHGRPVEVIPCCVDLDNFSAANAETRAMTRKGLGVEMRMVIVYVGSFGGWYMTEEMLDLFSAAREQDPNVFVLVLTQRNKEQVEENLRSRGLDAGDFYVGSVTPSEMPRYLCAADVAISFIKACYSKQSSSPTKIAEYLACGLPIIANPGVGDLDKLIKENSVGALVNDFSTGSYLNALNGIAALGDVRNKCRETAAREFDLESVGGKRYRRLYDRVLRRK